jgi:virulence factor Mce-like protein
MIGRLLRGSTHAVIARLSAIALAVMLVASIGGYLILHTGLFDRGPEYEAEFANAWPLVAGMDVRVSGAVAGSVRKVALTDRGTAEVTFQLKPGVPRPRADATVAIRQDDLLGDTDLSLSIGTAAQPLRSPISTARSIQEPRLDDFLNIFRRPVRTALKAFIVELGTALERRGVDVNAAILKLRPGFEALGEVLGELRTQNGALAQVITNSHAVTAQLAGHTSDLDRLVSGLRTTVAGVANHATQFDAGLARLPATLAATGATLGQVRQLTDAVAPLSQTVAAGASGFERASSLIGPYARALGIAARVAAPTIDLAGQALQHGSGALAALSKTSFSALLNPTSNLVALLKPVFSQLADGLFGSSHGGGLGGVVRPGNDVTAPGVDPTRDYLAAYLVPSCEFFGQPVAPGCLVKALGGSPRAAADSSRSIHPLLHYLLAR